jgi:neutral ceramidase
MKIWAGSSKIEITPTRPMLMGGYGIRTDESVGTHDPLHARATFLSDGMTSVLLIVCDLVAVGDDLTKLLREAISEKVDIPEEQVMIAATHTHAGPAAVRNLLDPEYTYFLIRQVVAVSLNARANKQQVVMSLMRAEVEGVSQNRRDSSFPVQRDLDILLAINLQGNVVSSLIFFSCHPTIMEYDNLDFSADFPGAAISILEKNLGGVATFLQGVCGDINPTWSAHTWRDVELNGNIVGSAALAVAYKGLSLQNERYCVNLSLGIEILQPSVPGKFISEGELVTLSRFIILKRQRPENVNEDDPEIRELEQTLRRDSSFENRKKLHPRLAFLRAKRYGWTNPSPRYLPGEDQLEIQAIRLCADVVILGLPGEFLLTVGEEIKAKSPFLHTLIVGYANGYFDYFPLARDFREHGYEVGRSIYGEGSTELVMNLAIDILKEVKQK